MKLKHKLMTKNACAIQYIAKDFIALPIDAKIHTISEYENILDVARGTIQNSIKSLIEGNAVVLESRGQLGTFIKSKCLNSLLRFAGINGLVGAMPLPYSRVLEGLGTAILHTIEEHLQVSANMSYVHGSDNRIERLLEQRCDFAILSKNAALHCMKQNKTLEIITEFGEGSYWNEPILLFKHLQHCSLEDGMRVGIDTHSIDHRLLTESLCLDVAVELIPMPYSDSLAALRNGTIDALVWHGSVDDEYLHKTAINYSCTRLESGLSTAVIVINTHRKDMKALLNLSKYTEGIHRMQVEVMNGSVMPHY